MRSEFLLRRRHDPFPGTIQIALLLCHRCLVSIMWMLNYIKHSLNDARAMPGRSSPPALGIPADPAFERLAKSKIYREMRLQLFVEQGAEY